MVGVDPGASRPPSLPPANGPSGCSLAALGRRLTRNSKRVTLAFGPPIAHDCADGGWADCGLEPA
eukprot:6647213-Alexandrium_andersonii.AAC.1